MTPLRLDAPAKLNLDLRVLGQRDDGYHLLTSQLVLLALADRLLLLPGCSGLRVEGDAAGVPVDGTNLAWRGLVAAIGGTPELECLTLEKRIPAAAGLGGGSSDAAAAWRLGRAAAGAGGPPSAGELAELARIGADVPFFASGLPAARVGGIGERVEAAAAVERDVVLVHPPFGLSTAAVFAELRPDEWGSGANDLLAPALRLRPELGDLIAEVRAAGGTPQLTGSGPTIYSLESDHQAAADLAERLVRRVDRSARVTLTRTRTGRAAIESIESIESTEEA